MIVQVKKQTHVNMYHIILVNLCQHVQFSMVICAFALGTNHSPEIMQ